MQRIQNRLHAALRARLGKAALRLEEVAEDLPAVCVSCCSRSSLMRGWRNTVETILFGAPGPGEHYQTVFGHRLATLWWPTPQM